MVRQAIGNIATKEITDVMNKATRPSLVGEVSLTLDPSLYGYKVEQLQLNSTNDAIELKSTTALLLLVKDVKFVELNAEAEQRIEIDARLTVKKQLSAQALIYDATLPGFAQAATDYIAAVIAASNTVQIAIYDPTTNTQAKLDAVPAPVWPVVPTILLS